MNTRVGHIANRQARLGGFVESPSPTLEASAKMIRIGMLAHPMMTGCLLDVLTLLPLMTKRGSSFGYESSHTHRGVSIGDFC